MLETLDICCRQKFMSIGQTGFPPADRLEQTYAEIEQILQDASVAYDELDVSKWDFAPITPIVKCE